MTLTQSVISGGGIGRPVVLRILILPDDLVVLTNGQVRILIVLQVQAAVQLDDLRDLEPIGVVGGHRRGLVSPCLIGINGQLVLSIDPTPICLGLLRNGPGNGLGVDAQIVMAGAFLIALFVGGREHDLVIPTIVLGMHLAEIIPTIGFRRGFDCAVLAAVDRGCTNQRPVLGRDPDRAGLRQAL